MPLCRGSAKQEYKSKERYPKLILINSCLESSSKEGNSTQSGNK